MRVSRTTYLLLALLIATLPFTATGGEGQGSAPRMVIIIDDLGDRPGLDFEVASLPVPLTCAILPHTPHARRIARHCREIGQEVMLHLPMQAESNNQLLGPGRLELDMEEKHFRQTFRESLSSVPGAVGVNNHMGSLLTRHPGAMTWLMEELAAEELFFVDSRTTAQSVAVDMAEEQSVPALRRDVFLDAVQDAEQIERELDRAIDLAQRFGDVVVIGHPYPETVEVLTRRLPWLTTETGVELHTVRSLMGLEAPPAGATDPEKARAEDKQYGESESSESESSHSASSRGEAP